MQVHRSGQQWPSDVTSWMTAQTNAGSASVAAGGAAVPGIGGIASNDVDQVTKTEAWERGASRTGPEGPRRDGKAVVGSFAG